MCFYPLTTTSCFLFCFYCNDVTWKQQTKTPSNLRFYDSWLRADCVLWHLEHVDKYSQQIISVFWNQNSHKTWQLMCVCVLRATHFRHTAPLSRSPAWIVACCGANRLGLCGQANMMWIGCYWANCLVSFVMCVLMSFHVFARLQKTEVLTIFNEDVHVV